MQLLAKTGLDQLIKDWIQKDLPFFGICLGFQALFEFSEEGDTQGLGIFEGSVKRFPPASETQLKVPHMGWNSVSFNDDSALTDGIKSGEDQFYFVHSYYVEPKNKDLYLFETKYGKPFCSGIRSGNCVAASFILKKVKLKDCNSIQIF